MILRRATVFGALVTACIALSGCDIGEIVDDGDSFKDRQHALDAVYEQGKSSRSSMEKLGVIVDERSCGDAWSTSGAKEEHLPKNTTRKDNENFQEMRRLSFINGCMNRPKDLPAVTAPPLRPRPSTSPSV